MPSPNHGQAIWGGGTSRKINIENAFSMNNFVTPGTSGTTPHRRFTISNDKWVFSSGTSNPVDMPSGRSLWQSTSDERAPNELGGNGIGNSVPNDLQRKRSHDSGGPQGQMEYKDVALRTVTNRWIASSTSAKLQDIDTPAVIGRKVKGLLNKLHPANFDSISDQLIVWANKSDTEKDGRILSRVTSLVLESATDEEKCSETCGRLCQKMMKQINPKIQDDSIRNSEGKPIVGGKLFRKYLLDRCQEDFERGWGVKAVHDAAKQAKSKHADNVDCQPFLYSDEYYAIQKVRRQGLGLIRFLGELFKVQMLTERVMHECIKKLLGNKENPEAEEIESLCKLLTTIGQILDIKKARAHMDVYFSRMKGLTRGGIVNPRLQILLLVRMFWLLKYALLIGLLQDVIKLRERGWKPRILQVDAVSQYLG